MEHASCKVVFSACFSGVLKAFVVCKGFRLPALVELVTFRDGVVFLFFFRYFFNVCSAPHQFGFYDDGCYAVLAGQYHSAGPPQHLTSIHSATVVIKVASFHEGFDYLWQSSQGSFWFLNCVTVRGIAAAVTEVASIFASAIEVLCGLSVTQRTRNYAVNAHQNVYPCLGPVAGEWMMLVKAYPITKARLSLGLPWLSGECKFGCTLTLRLEFRTTFHTCKHSPRLLRQTQQYG